MSSAWLMFAQVPTASSSMQAAESKPIVFTGYAIRIRRKQLRSVAESAKSRYVANRFAVVPRHATHLEIHDGSSYIHFARYSSSGFGASGFCGAAFF